MSAGEALRSVEPGGDQLTINPANRFRQSHRRAELSLAAEPGTAMGSTGVSLGIKTPEMLRTWLTMLLLATALLASTGCGRQSDQDDHESAATPTTNELPPLDLTDDTPNLLLTWVDAKGDFHVVQQVGDVPEAGRERVRVVQTNREAGTGQLVYVADLRTKTADGKYPVQTLTRAQWDEIGAERRKQRLEALAPSASASAPAPPPKIKPGELVVVVYGADWCKPCHDAERYLKRRGVDVRLKNIEEDAVARAELQGKLKRANLPGTAQIPIIDVGGQLLVGFSPSALDRALKRVEAGEIL
jgi:glutaredoxin